MRVRRAGLLWLLAGCGPLLVLAYVVLALAGGHAPVTGDTRGLQDIYPNIVLGTTVPLIGALVLSRIPRHPVGWLYVVCGIASGATLTTWELAHTLLAHHLAGGVALAWVSDWVWGFGFIPLATLGLLLFPDGRTPTRWLRPVLVSDIAAVALLFVGSAFHPGVLENFARHDNPVGVPLPAGVFDLLTGIGQALFAIGLMAGVLAVVLRWRRADGTQREALRWVALAATGLVSMVLIPDVPGRAIGDAAVVLLIPLMPLTMAAAILRGRLYGVEVAVRRSLVYAALTTLLLLVYAVVVITVGALVPDRATQAGALLATTLVAIAFAPLRARVQDSVDRMLYGDRRDPYKVLSGLGRRLDTADAVPLAEAASTIASSLRLPYVRIEVDGEVPLVAEDGTPAAQVHDVPLVFRGEQVGRLVVAPRSPRDPFRPADLRLLDDLGRQLGVTAHATRLAAALQRSREGLVTAREEERRRIRRDLHDGLGPALAGVALGLDAVARLVPDEPRRATALAGQLKAEVHASLADVRRLVEDLRPPALDQLGLVGAVRQQARLLTERDPGLEVGVETSGLSELPAAIEVAAYRIATEALHNVSRHASARHCRVCLSLNGSGVLHLEIEDDGVGMSSTRRIGVGLSAMSERAAELGGTCVTGPAALGGTRVTALLPVVPQ